MEQSFVNLWSIIEKASVDQDITIKKSKDNKNVSVLFHKTRKFNFFGWEITKRKLVAEYNLVLEDQLSNVFSSAMNPVFAGDQYVDYAKYMKFSESGFRENETNDYKLDLLHCAIGMAGEAGEVLELVKKHIFHSKPLDAVDMTSELGDYEWYKSNFLRLLNIKFGDVLKGNVVKLTTRYPNGRDKNYLKNDKNHTSENQKIEEALKK